MGLEQELILTSIEEALGDNKAEVLGFIEKLLSRFNLDKDYLVIDKNEDKLTLYLASKAKTSISFDEDDLRVKDYSYIIKMYKDLTAK